MMTAPYHPDFATDKALARRLGRPASRSGLSGGFLGSAKRADKTATVAFGATALFGGILIFALLETLHSGDWAAALAWALTGVMSASSASLIQLWRRSIDEKLEQEAEADRLRGDIERLRKQIRGEAAMFGSIGDARY